MNNDDPIFSPQRAVRSIEREFAVLQDEYADLCRQVEGGGFSEEEGLELHAALQEVMLKLERKGAQMAALHESI